MDGNLAMANILENNEHPADIFEAKYGFTEEQSMLLESIYFENNLAGKSISIHDLAMSMQALKKL